MKTFRFLMTRLSILNSGSVRLCALAACVIGVPLGARAVEIGKTFATPDDAVAAFASAVRTQNVDNLRNVLGPDSDDLENPDRVQATNEFRAVAQALDQRTHLVRESETNYVIELGTNAWPFPIPIVKNNDGRWFFDTAAGKEELLNRRIGKNELEAIGVMRAYVGAQREYASRDRNGDGVLQFAEKLASSPGKTDGLYWPPELNGEISPLGPLIADAQGSGYFGNAPDADDGPQPFYGYFFKVLKGQGKHAQGGKKDYVSKGKMTGGFALVAWPADYDDSGVMTFIVNQQGVVYQKDLGPKTSKLVSEMKLYDPDDTWDVTQD
jgi:hypothetical protein